MSLAYTVPVPGSTLNSVADPEVASALQTILTWANGQIQPGDIAAALAQSAGVNQTGQVTKGVCVNAGPGTRTNVAYGALSDAPDQVSGIVLPANGLIRVWYQALWEESVAGAARAAIFLNANQLQAQISQGGVRGPQTVAAATGASAASILVPLFTAPALGPVSVADVAGSAADATTGQTVGDPGDRPVSAELGGSLTTVSTMGGSCDIFAGAGTYTVSVQFKCSSGTVTAQGRKLWVQALSFA